MTQINMCAKDFDATTLFFSLLSIKCLALLAALQVPAPHGKNNLLKGYLQSVLHQYDRKNSSDEFDDDNPCAVLFHHGL